MDILILVQISFVAFIHFYFMWFEMFAWTTVGRKTFKNFPPDYFVKTKSLAANQGLYNGFLASGLVWSLFISDEIWSANIALFFLGCVVVAGVYAAYSVSKRIFYIQALPALVTIILIFLK